jgi:hypothetical protein
MNENNKFFYPSDMFDFIHHLEYECRDLKGLMIKSFLAALIEKKNVFWDISTKPKIGILKN